jgi:hypothetical protein
MVVAVNLVGQLEGPEARVDGDLLLELEPEAVNLSSLWIVCLILQWRRVTVL